MELSNSGNDKLQALRPRYLERLRQRIVLLERTIENLAEARYEIHRAAHSMKSSALRHGYLELSEAARNVEILFDTHDNDVDVLRERLTLLIAEARKTVDAAEPPTVQ